MKVLVIGGTGTVGSAVVAELRARGHEPRVMTRVGRQGRVAPGRHHARRRRPRAARRRCRPRSAGVDGVFLLAPVGPNETAQALAGVEAARPARVGHLVYLSVVMPPGSQVIPHFASKMPVEQAVQASGLPWTILRPNNFFQNDVWFRDAITTFGVYPQPLGPRGLNRVDVRDIAEAAVNAFTRGVGRHRPAQRPARPDRRRHGARVQRAARAARSGTAATISTCGRSRRRRCYPAVDGARTSGSCTTTSSAAARTRAAGTSPRRRALLGHAPRSFEAFAAELVKDWGRRGSSGRKAEAAPYRYRLAPQRGFPSSSSPAASAGRATSRPRR